MVDTIYSILTSVPGGAGLAPQVSQRTVLCTPRRELMRQTQAFWSCMTSRCLSPRSCQ